MRKNRHSRNRSAAAKLFGAIFRMSSFFPLNGALGLTRPWEPSRLGFPITCTLVFGLILPCTHLRGKHFPTLTSRPLPHRRLPHHAARTLHARRRQTHLLGTQSPALLPGTAPTHRHALPRH